MSIQCSASVNMSVAQWDGVLEQSGGYWSYNGWHKQSICMFAGSKNSRAAAAAAAKSRSDTASSNSRAEAAAASSRIRQQAEAASQAAQQSKKSAEDEVEDMLAALKKRMGKT